RCAVIVLMATYHGERQKRIADRAVQWHTQVARRVAHHEGDEFGSGLFGGEDEVALVLAILVVNVDNGVASGDIGNRPLHGVQPRHHISMNHGCACLIAAPLSWADTPIRRRDLSVTTGLRRSCQVLVPLGSSPEPSNRSTYFAMMSTSRLTRVPTSALPSVVRSNVVGINDTSNQSWPRPETVRDTPPTVIDPFSTTYRDSAVGSAIRTTSQCSDGVRAITWPVPSTCPWTMCPPRRLLTAAARSRFTWLPTPTPRRLERFKVSPITSALNAPSGSTSTTVRQTPFTAIESPCPASEVTTGPRRTRRAESPSSSLPTISPSSSTIPVNTLTSLAS